MTNVLAGAYPNIFKAGSVYSGVPDGCFFVSGATAGQATPGWNNDCANGRSVKTAQAWGDLTRSYYPGYNGTYPKMLMWVFYRYYYPVILAPSTWLTCNAVGMGQQTPHSDIPTLPKR